MGLTTEPTVHEPRRPPTRWPSSFADSRLNPWRGLGGLPREVWLLFATNLINRAGMMVLPFLVLYLTRELGFSPSRAGLMLALYGASAIVFGPIGGRLSDRIGALPVMRVSLIASGLMLLLFPMARSFVAVAVMTVLWSGFAELFRPASLAAITPRRTPSSDGGFALKRLAIKLGRASGPAGRFFGHVRFRDVRGRRRDDAAGWGAGATQWRSSAASIPKPRTATMRQSARRRFFTTGSF